MKIYVVYYFDKQTGLTTIHELCKSKSTADKIVDSLEYPELASIEEKELQ